MNPNNQEIEVKFYLNDLPALQRRLEAAGASLATPRVHEINLRFDLPDRSLTAAHRVLRLRQDERARLTYKGPAQDSQGASARVEIEFTVEDFGQAQALLEALGYQVSVAYEKYRATYRLGRSLVTLDEMPYGSFCEIEGPGGAEIEAAAGQLGLRWADRIQASYLELFERLKAGRGLPLQNLTFAELQGLKVEPGDLGVRPAG